MPIYMVEGYLPKCIESILKQTYSTFELLLIDDGSPDRCGQICDEYALQDARTMNITEKTGKLVTIKSVTDENDLMIINKSGITIRLKVADVRIMGRATQGVRLINLEKRNDQIGSVCKVMTESLEDEIPAEEAEGTIVSDPNADAPDIDDVADVNENESNNEIEE